MTSAKRHHRPPHTRRFVQRLLSALALIILLYGFVANTRIALDIQAHAPPGAEHPYDFYAEVCLGSVMILLAVIFLSRPTPRRWRKSVRPRAQNEARSGRKSAKRRRRSGYNKPK